MAERIGGSAEADINVAPWDFAGQWDLVFGEGRSRSVTVDGGGMGVRTFRLPEQQEEYEDFKERAEANRQEVRESVQENPDEETSALEGILDDLGIQPGQIRYDARSMLANAGINPDAEDPALQQLIAYYQNQFDNLDQAQAQNAVAEFTLLFPSLQANPDYAIPAETPYDQVLEMSGFAGQELPKPEIKEKSLRGARARGVSAQDLQGTQHVVEPPKFERSDEGWFRHRNGTLVDPDGKVYYDPASTAPGSVAWQRNAVTSWSAERVLEEKKKLVDFGYLPKESAKNAKVDQVFLNALGAYHDARYRYGKPVAAEAGGYGSADGSTTKPEPVQLRDLDSQIRNSVREEFRRVYGTEPTDGQVATWANYVIRTGMELQRRFINKYDTPNTESAVREASESFIEKLEGSPQAEFLREADEENTRLRETFDRMAQVTNSLVT